MVVAAENTVVVCPEGNASNEEILFSVPLGSWRKADGPCQKPPGLVELLGRSRPHKCLNTCEEERFDADLTCLECFLILEDQPVSGKSGEQSG